MKPLRTPLWLAVLCLTLVTAACRSHAATAVPSPAPAATTTTAQAVATQPRPTASADPAPSPTRPSPMVTAAPTVEPSPTPPWQTRLHIHPEQLWAIEVPAAWQPGEPRDERLTVFSGPEAGVMLVVDSYLGTAGEYGNTGEGLRNRARDVVAQLYGPDLPCDNIEPEDYRWETGVIFEDSDVKGEALYAQPGRDWGDYRVYGVILAYPPDAEATARPLLEAVRDTFKGATALELQVPAGGEPLWALHSHGFRGFDPNMAGGHFVAIFARTASGWQERARLAVQTPDYVAPGSVWQVQIEPSHIWLAMEGSMGAHSGTFHLLRYDEGRLRVEVESSSAAPGAASLADLDGDGGIDVILNQTDAYVFCYACGVRYPAFEVLHWDGAGLARVEMVALPDSAPAAVRDPINRAVELARAGLWKDAVATLAGAPATTDPVALWNTVLIRLHAEAFARQAQEGAYPLLDLVFYGDYAAALDVVRRYRPAEIFDPAGPLIAGTPAEGSELELSEWMTRVTSAALEAEPELAAAYYLRGWATQLANPGSAEALADIERAAQLAPDEALFAESLAHLQQ